MAKLEDIEILRGETQKNVNYETLKIIAQEFSEKSAMRVLDLPCGQMLLLRYIRTLFPKATLCGIDIVKPAYQEDIRFLSMDLSKEFWVLPPEEKFDLVTSISGIMMFGNTASFIANCAARVQQKGVFIVTNDNSSTIMDRLAFLFLGRYRIFKLLYEDAEQLTQNISIQELCRLLRINGFSIEKIKYTSFYLKDIVYFPIACLVYPFQWLYTRTHKTSLPSELKWKMFPFKQYFCKHYIVVARKN